MSDVTVNEAIRRQEIFKDLGRYLQNIKERAKKMDPEAEVYLFGSVAEGRHTYSSDVDVLVITREEPGRVQVELWKAGIKDPFEIHIQPPEGKAFYERKASLTQV